MSYKFVIILFITASINLGCGNKDKTQLVVLETDQPFQEKTSKQPERPKDKLEQKGNYQSIKGAEIICDYNSETSAKLSTTSCLSEEEIKAFIADREVSVEKTLSIQYKGLNLPPYAAVVDGKVTYNDGIPRDYTKAKKYQQQLEEKKKREQAEKERKAKLEEKANRKTIIGKWLNAGFPICLYKQRGKYYLGSYRSDNNIEELYEVTRVSSKRYENRDNGDMPERFDIMSNGNIRTHVYNPDAPGGGRWVFMGDWMSLN